MTTAVHVHDGGSFVAAVVMWQAMMVAMMAPIVAPWVTTFAALAARDGRSRGAAVVAFGGGYFVAWLGYSVTAAFVQLLLQRRGMLGTALALPSSAGALVLIGAGLFQLTPLKQACLTHCRNPLTYFLRRWHDGPPDGFGVGLRHGLYCVGCCWALMATAFALGVMNVAWMAGLVVVMAVEQWVPRGVVIGRLAGVAIAAWGVARLVRAG